MSRDPLAGFAELRYPDDDGVEEETVAEPETYPGSKMKRRAVAPPEPRKRGLAGYEPVILNVQGVPTEFYTVGVLAALLERQPPTIRKWERLGYIPESRFRTPGRTKHGQKRLYTRPQVEGIVRIATEEGLVGESNRNCSATKFPERVRVLFEELRRK